MRKRLMAALWLCAIFGIAGSAAAGGGKGITRTKHNLSASGPGTIKATTDQPMCQFCHPRVHYSDFR